MALGDKLINMDGLKAAYDSVNGPVTDLKDGLAVSQDVTWNYGYLNADGSVSTASGTGTPKYSSKFICSGTMHIQVKYSERRYASVRVCSYDSAGQLIGTLTEFKGYLEQATDFTGSYEYAVPSDAVYVRVSSRTYEADGENNYSFTISGTIRTAKVATATEKNAEVIASIETASASMQTAIGTLTNAVTENTGDIADAKNDITAAQAGIEAVTNKTLTEEVSEDYQSTEWTQNQGTTTDTRTGTPGPLAVDIPAGSVFCVHIKDTAKLNNSDEGLIEVGVRYAETPGAWVVPTKYANHQPMNTDLYYYAPVHIIQLALYATKNITVDGETKTNVRTNTTLQVTARAINFHDGALDQAFVPVEYGAARNAYAYGDTIMIGNHLYQVTAPIAVGDRLADETNIRPVKSQNSRIPAYWNDMIASVKTKVRDRDIALKTGDRFFFITDPHWKAQANKVSSDIISELADYFRADLCLLGGDMVKADTGSSENGYTEIADYIRSFRNPSLRLFATAGNHDRMDPITDRQVYNAMMRQMETFCETTGDLLGAVYDNKSQKVRYIQFQHATPSDSETYTISDARKAWMREKCTGLPTGWTIVVMCHAYWNNDIIPQSTQRWSEFLIGLKDEGAPIALWLVGHCHKDQYDVINGASTKLLVVSTTTDNVSEAQTGTMEKDGETVPISNRENGTDKEAAFDFVHLDTTDKKVYFTRIGGWFKTAGEQPVTGDRAFNYETGTVL